MSVTTDETRSKGAYWALKSKRRMEAQGYSQTSVYLTDDDKKFLLEIKEKHGAKNQTEALGLALQWARHAAQPQPDPSVSGSKPTE